jgi:hypothetical protein
MPSRKKAQGQARRKAKAEVEDAESKRKEEPLPLLNRQMQQLVIRSLAATHDDDDRCMHGFVQFPVGHVCAQFITTFTSVLFSGGDLTVSVILADSFDKALGAVEKYILDSAKIEAIVSFFLYLGTQDILAGGGSRARFSAFIAAYFEQYNAMMTRKTPAAINVPKMIEMLHADSNSLVSFFRKRVPCSCLDGKYKEVKSIAKMGFCCNLQCPIPVPMVKRSTMLYCTRCRRANYCSRECQVAHWPSHRDMCNIFAEQIAKFSASKQK